MVPKVAFDTELDLIPALERLGMKTPFSDKADFSNPYGHPGLHLDGEAGKPYLLG